MCDWRYGRLLGLALGMTVSSASAEEIINATEATMVLTSTASNTAFANSTTIVNDVDGDGWRDIAVGALLFDPYDDEGDEITNAGVLFIFSGQTGQIIHQLEGWQELSNLGMDCLVVPDRDGDEVDEILATVSALDDYDHGLENVGGFAVFSGATGEHLATETCGSGANMNLGYRVAEVGDLNDDAFPEFILGSYTNVGPGVAVLYDGASLTLLHQFTGYQEYSGFGSAVAGGSDFNSDGVPDIVLGAEFEDIDIPEGGPILDGGVVYVYSGADYALIRTLEREDDGMLRHDNLGHSLATIGDLNGDDVDEIIAGAWERNEGYVGGLGHVMVFSGADGEVIYDLPGLGFPGMHGDNVLAVADLDGDSVPDFAGTSLELGVGYLDGLPGRVIVYSGATGEIIRQYLGEEPDDIFGHSIDTGDLNGNGVPDFVVGAPSHIATTPYPPGKAYVFLGAGPECPGDLDGDGDVDLSDLAILLSNYGTTSGAGYEDGDLDGDGDVDLSDLAALLAVYGTTYP
ncbi:MAG: integrin alpha [Planctomycetes bacterium]|nr:integrin alpha [Planctomycetota bacterium]